MAKSESTQQTVGRVRPPRVQITYEVEKNGAIEHKELPFVVGVLGNFSGKPEQPLPKLKHEKRKFIEINRDTFDEVMAGMRPRAAYRVDNLLEKNGTQIPIDITFNSIEDFKPDNVAKQVPPLKELLDLREHLAEMKNTLGNNAKLEELLLEVLQSTEKLHSLGSEVGNRDTGSTNSGGETT